MGKQISFKLPEIDREKTQEVVKAALGKYRFYLLTEQAVIDRVDFEKERDEYIEKIRREVNRLNYKERELIIKRYLNEDEVYDYELYNDTGYSERKYYRMKARIFYKLAFILRIEVYKNEEHS